MDSVVSFVCEIVEKQQCVCSVSLSLDEAALRLFMLLSLTLVFVVLKRRYVWKTNFPYLYLGKQGKLNE